MPDPNPNPPTPDPRDAEIARLQAALRTPAPPAAPAPAQPSKKDVEALFWGNPLDTSAAIATQAVRTELAGTQETLAELARQQARGTDPEMSAFFDKHIDEITANVNSVAPQFRGNVTVWKNAFAFVKGQHLDEILEIDRKRTPGGPVRTPDGPSAPSVRQPNAPASVKLSDEELTVSRGLGLTEAQYAHGKRFKAEQQGRGNSPWDEAITTDSAQAATKKRMKQNDAA
jgi:hypothetical protein